MRLIASFAVSIFALTVAACGDSHGPNDPSFQPAVPASGHTTPGGGPFQSGGADAGTSSVGADGGTKVASLTR